MTETDAMQQSVRNESEDIPLFLAGEYVSPGVYQEVSNGREILLDREDYLPASLDGKVACYRRMQPKWGEMQNRHHRKA